MALSDNPFVGLPLDQLLQIQATWLQVLNDIALVGQSYTFPNRSLTKANLPEVMSVLSQISIAVKHAQPTSSNAGKQMAQATIDTQMPFSR